MVKFNFLLLLLSFFPIASHAQVRDSVLVCSDEFEKPSLPDSTKWKYESGYVRNNELQYFTVGHKENARAEKLGIDLACLFRSVDS